MNNIYLQVLLVIGAIIRSTFVLTRDDIGLPIRKLAKKVGPITGEAVSCPDCMSVWIGAFYTTLYYYYPVAIAYVGIALTASLLTGIAVRRINW